MAIPELNIDNSTETRIWQAFDDWGDHFKRRLRKTGPRWQIEKLHQLLDILNRPDEEIWSVEFLSYLQRRDALQIIESLIPSKEWTKFSDDVSSFDKKLRSLWVKGPTVFELPREPRNVYWWYYDGLPKGVIP